MAQKSGRKKGDERRERETDRQTETERETDRQTDRAELWNMDQWIKKKVVFVCTGREIVVVIPLIFVEASAM